ncbi:MAG: hypothetical protein RIQ99_1345, partial [Pseudomonadota bacterium]
LGLMADRFVLTLAQLCDPAKFEFYVQQGLCWQRDARIGVTDAGIELLDALLGELVPAELVGA